VRVFGQVGLPVGGMLTSLGQVRMGGYG
jgi:hypothetical protein